MLTRSRGNSARYVAVASATAICFALGCPGSTSLPPEGVALDAGFEALEMSCDGFDNDGDGRVDVSRPIRIMRATRYQQAFASRDGGFVAVLETGAGLVAQLLTYAFEDAGRVELPGTNERSRFAWATGKGDEVVVAWSQGDAGSEELIGITWLSSGGSAVLPFDASPTWMPSPIRYPVIPFPSKAVHGTRFDGRSRSDGADREGKPVHRSLLVDPRRQRDRRDA